METQFNARIQILRFDNGGEFVNHDFHTYFQTHGIIHETTCPETPQQNGVAERKNRHVLETARALLISGHVPHHHSDDVVVTAVHFINCMPSGVLNFRTPLQVLAQHEPLPSILGGDTERRAQLEWLGKRGYSSMLEDCSRPRNNNSRSSRVWHVPMLSAKQRSIA
ncbi:hypothetical protein L3X38_011535 [Prunus dulcis]|uniref:Integrase catalytic domain-containing protein n=1 Tax=Prunus dulcis TaxID=3755 RepID=A0AAD4ZF79_PRUDU|nr:hypothetical protein L3X38_011535 [Prunus dulcis]